MHGKLIGRRDLKKGVKEEGNPLIMVISLRYIFQNVLQLMKFS
jgi:hypothetical protein